MQTPPKQIDSRDKESLAVHLVATWDCLKTSSLCPLACLSLSAMLKEEKISRRLYPFGTIVAFVLFWFLTATSDVSQQWTGQAGCLLHHSQTASAGACTCQNVPKKIFSGKRRTIH